jgi:hypothetical protein
MDEYVATYWLHRATFVVGEPWFETGTPGSCRDILVIMIGLLTGRHENSEHTCAPFLGRTTLYCLRK